MKPYEPFPTMQKEVNSLKCQMIQNTRMHRVKTRAYAHWSRVTDTVPVIYIVEQNCLSRCYSLWLIQGPGSGKSGTTSGPGSAAGSEGRSGIDRKLRVLQIQWNPLDHET